MHTLFTRRISKLWTCQDHRITHSHLNTTNFYLESSTSWLEIFLAAVRLVQHQYCLPLFFMGETMILSMLLKFGICHHCWIGVKGAKRNETGFGCRTCMKHLGRSGSLENITDETISFKYCSNYIFHKLLRFCYFPRKFLVFHGNLSEKIIKKNALNYTNLLKQLA